ITQNIDTRTVVIINQIILSAPLSLHPLSLQNLGVILRPLKVEVILVRTLFFTFILWTYFVELYSFFPLCIFLDAGDGTETKQVIDGLKVQIEKPPLLMSFYWLLYKTLSGKNTSNIKEQIFARISYNNLYNQLNYIGILSATI
ncbi:hypothetical protein ACJX0J_006104, partial [Zea mays]